jgi:hypothetical protein
MGPETRALCPTDTSDIRQHYNWIHNSQLNCLFRLIQGRIRGTSSPFIENCLAVTATAAGSPRLTVPITFRP